jgi:hypothetical protein
MWVEITKAYKSFIEGQQFSCTHKLYNELKEADAIKDVDEQVHVPPSTVDNETEQTPTSGKTKSKPKPKPKTNKNT